MAINVPQYRRLQNEQEFSHILTENVWEIWVPRNDNIEWAIVLSCLLSNRLPERFIKQENWGKYIKNFNPFLDRFSFSQNDTLKKIVHRFKDYLQANFKETNLTEVDATVKLRCASDCLNCNIYLFTKDMKSCDEFVAKNTLPSGVIILFKSERDEVGNSFGLPESHCQKWREDALKNVLLKTNIKEQTFENVWKTVKDSEHFLIALLKSDMKDIIEELCYSPLITRKLIDSGYQADPAKKDLNGLSAFYHALVTGNLNLCISVYHIGIFCCTEGGLSTREPNRKIITNLRNLKETLNYDFGVLKKACENTLETNHNLQILPIKTISYAYEKGLICSSLISLRIEVEETILTILEETENFKANQVNDEKFQIQQQRNILLSILNIYSNHSKKLFQDQSLENYAKYKEYFDVIDIDVSLFFFDYNFKLKKKLKLPDENTYACTESSFFIFLLNHVIFNRKVRKSAYFTKLFNMSRNNTFEIPFMIREYVFGKIELFYYILTNTAVDEEVIRKGIPDKEFNLILHEYPEIKSYFLIRRLTSYIENALSVKHKKNSKMIFVFIIERVLQVIGEFIKLEPDDDFDVKWFLSLYMPKNIRQVFHDLRNMLSHLDNHEFMNKINLEEDTYLFENIQSDIRNMYNYLQPLLNVMTEKLIMYIEEKLLVSSNTMNAPRRFKREFQRNIERMVESILDTVQFFRNASTDDLTMVFENILNHLDEQLMEKKKELAKVESKLFQKKFQFQVKKDEIFSSIKKMLQPIKYLINLFVYKFQLLVQYSIRYMEYYETAKNILNHFELFNNDLNISSFVQELEFLIEICKKFIPLVRTSSNDNQFNHVRNTEIFLKLLKSSTFITNEDKEMIKKYFYKKLEEDFSRREKIKSHIHEGFTMNEEDLKSNRISYILPEEWNIFLGHYRKKKKDRALKSLDRHDPLIKLEYIFKENSVKKRELEILKRRIPLSDKIQEILGKLVKGTQTRIVSNRLCHLKDRIIHLEIILIGEEVSWDMWKKDKPILVQQIFNRYVEDRRAKLATEMLIFDCMNLFEKKIDQWEKSSGLFQGIDLRNIIAHEDIIIQNICEWFDPSDLPSDVVRTVIGFLEDKRIIVAILELYEKANKNFKEFFKLLKSEVEKTGLVDDKNSTLNKIMKYVELLPDADLSRCVQHFEINN